MMSLFISCIPLAQGSTGKPAALSGHFLSCGILGSARFLREDRSVLFLLSFSSLIHLSSAARFSFPTHLLALASALFFFSHFFFSFLFPAPPPLLLLLRALGVSAVLLKRSFDECLLIAWKQPFDQIALFDERGTTT